MKKLLTIISLIFITSCSSNSFTYLQKPTSITKNQTKYYVADVDIKFVDGLYHKARGEVAVFNLPKSMHKDFSAYPNQEELSEIFKNAFEKKLKEKEIYSDNKEDPNTLELSFKADYERLGIAWSKTAYNFFAISHEAIISKNKKEIARSKVSNYKAKRGSVSNLKSIFAQKGPEDEIEDINIVTESLVREISNLGK
jgi:hypothetical protein